ncbi:unnamed protein product [Calypogeia fissa]
MCCTTGLSGHSHRRCRQTGQICVLAVYEDPGSGVAGQTGRPARRTRAGPQVAARWVGNVQGRAGAGATPRDRRAGKVANLGESRCCCLAADHSARMARAALPGSRLC